MLNLTYEYRIYPSADQEATMLGWLEHCRRVFNYGLRERKDWIRSRKCDINACSIRSEYIIPADAPKPTYIRQQNALTKYRQNRQELQSVHSQVLQGALRQLDDAFKNMMIFAEDLNLKAMSKGMLCKHTLDAGFGQFLSILNWVCWKRGVYFAKVDPNGTSQTCPRCDAHVPKDLGVRIHSCLEC